jgi:hypothetical protein
LKKALSGTGSNQHGIEKITHDGQALADALTGPEGGGPYRGMLKGTLGGGQRTDHSAQDSCPMATEPENTPFST